MSKEKTRDCKMQLLNHVDDKAQLLWDIDTLNVAIDSLNDELKELSAENRVTSKILRAVMREEEQSVSIEVNANNTN